MITIILGLERGQLVQSVKRGQLLQLLEDVLRKQRTMPLPRSPTTIVIDHSMDSLCPPEAKKGAEEVARMARDPDVHFVVSTCNPYVLLSLIEKSPKEQLTVLIERDSKFRRLTETQIEEILDLEVDVFFNIDKLFEEALPIDF